MTALIPAVLAISLAQAAGDPAASRPAPIAAEAPAPDAPAVPPSARRYGIERIIVAGLRHAREAEVRRHLLVAEGDVLDEERVLLSRLRLLQLGWFSKVETRVERGSERGLVVLVFEVVERNTLLVTDLVLGSTGPQPIYGGLGLSQQNFLGRGFGLSGAFVYGGSPAGRPQDPSRFAIRGSFFAPDLPLDGVLGGAGRALVVGATVLVVRGEELACGDPECEAFDDDFGAAPRLRYQRAAFEGTIGIRPGAFERLLASYRFERLREMSTGIAATAAGDTPAPSLLPGHSRLSALTGTYEIDTRDDFFMPREGLRGLAQVTFGSRLLGSDYEYSRYLLQLETAFGLFDLPLRLQCALGASQGGAPFFERFYPADFSYFAIGPALARSLELNFSTDSRYDAFVAMAGVEYAVPLWHRQAFFRRGYLALGLRGVYSSETLGGARTAFSSSPVSAEAALRLDTPVGVFNLSLGYLVDILL
ncbi:MAG TPA: BamA/TamA family outer membrane protein [Anaeromyxobacter sp.]|nr:BamA/TamA family outer membrane protein [Anaeromyxobacter sp.]